MFCTYDKVARVKNKWKCVLKDGMVSIGGKDYLFNKCNGFVYSDNSSFKMIIDPYVRREFEW